MNSVSYQPAKVFLLNINPIFSTTSSTTFGNYIGFLVIYVCNSNRWCVSKFIKILNRNLSQSQLKVVYVVGAFKNGSCNSDFMPLIFSVLNSKLYPLPLVNN